MNISDMIKKMGGAEVAIITFNGSGRKASLYSDGTVIPHISGGNEGDGGSGGSEGDGGTGGGTGAQNSQGGISVEDQARVDNAIKENFTRANIAAERRADEKYGGEIESLKKEIESLKNPSNGNPANGNEGAGVNVDAMKEKMKSMETQLGSARTAKAKGLVAEGLTKYQFVNNTSISDIVAQIGGNITIDEHEKVTIKVNGVEPRNDVGDPMNVMEYVDSYMSDRKYLLTAEGQSGSGSKGANGAGGIPSQAELSPQAIKDMSDAEFDEFLKSGITINGTKHVY